MNNVDDMRHELVTLGGGAHALAIQILGNSDDAADAVQDALAIVLGRPEAYEPRKGPLRAWFLAIVRNRCLDLLRRRRRNDGDLATIEDPADGPEQSAERAEQDDCLARSLAALAPEQREIIVLRDYLDLPYAQIASVLDVPQGTVMSRLHRARVALCAAYREISDE